MGLSRHASPSRDQAAVKLSTDAAATAVHGNYTRVYVLVPSHSPNMPDSMKCIGALYLFNAVQHACTLVSVSRQRNRCI